MVRATIRRMARVHLVDALPYVFRAYFSMPPTMTSPDGRPINAVHGFASFLIRLLEEERVTHLAVAFDESLTSSFRNEMLPTYKSSRELPPDELVAQLEDCQALCRAAGAFVTASDRYEADDLIATLARRLDPAGHDVVIVTSDKDLSQLVTARTTLYDFGKGFRLGRDEVIEKMGVPPELVPDLLGLMGDAVDDIPGVPGIGAKTAAALVQALGSLESILDRLDEVAKLPVRGAKALPAKLTQHRELALLSKRLAVVADDAPLTASLDDLLLRAADADAIGAICDRLGLRGHRDRLLRPRTGK